MKTAKDMCNKDQKVIKVPNTNVFRIVAPLLFQVEYQELLAENLIAI